MISSLFFISPLNNMHTHFHFICTVPILKHYDVYNLTHMIKTTRCTYKCTRIQMLVLMQETSQIIIQNKTLWFLTSLTNRLLRCWFYCNRVSVPSRHNLNNLQTTFEISLLLLIWYQIKSFIHIIISLWSAAFAISKVSELKVLNTVYIVILVLWLTKCCKDQKSLFW